MQDPKVFSIDELSEIARNQGISSLTNSLSELINAYQKAYAATPSSHTARAKRNDLSVFQEFLAQQYKLKKGQPLKLEYWSPSSLQSFINAKLSAGEAPSTVARRIATLKHLGRVLCERIPGLSNPTREVRGPKAQELRPKGLSAVEITNLRMQAERLRAERPNFIRYRNLVIFELLLNTGLRADEARLLKRSQLTDDVQWFQGVRTKGNKYRDVYISSALRPLLKEYLKLRTQELKRYFKELQPHVDKKLPLFVSNYKIVASDPSSFEIAEKTLWRAINGIGRALKIHPHTLRHTFALGILENTSDIRLVAQALGHSSVQTTMRYTERTREDVARAIEDSLGKK